MLEQVLEGIGAKKRFFVTSHARPDGDAVGSALACGEILRGMGKHADVGMADGIPHIYGTLPYADQMIEGNLLRPEYDAVIILECDSLARTGLNGFHPPFVINIDHHFSAKPFGNINWMDPEACATAEMIFRLGRGAGVKITKDIATCLYTAVMTDTGSFRFAGTNERTFALAGELIHCGADPVQCANNVYFANPFSKMKLLGSALSTLRREGSVAWMHITRAQIEECKALDEEAEGLVNYALSIEGIQVAAFFREMSKRRCRVSLRSKPGVDVAAIAESFGGGGHHNASGCSVDAPLALATEKILAKLRACLAAGATAPAISTE